MYCGTSIIAGDSVTHALTTTQVYISYYLNSTIFPQNVPVKLCNFTREQTWYIIIYNQNVQTVLALGEVSQSCPR